MNNKKTILYLVTQSELGGVQQYIYDLATNLRDEFNVVVAFGEQGKNGELAKKLEKSNVKFYELPHLKREICPTNDLLAFAEIIKLIKKVKPDVVHLNSSKISILGSLATKLANRKIKTIYTVHGWVFNEPMSNAKKLFYKYSEKFTAFFKDKLICVSEYDRQIAIKEKITSPEKLVTIHNGIKKINFFQKDEALKILGKSKNDDSKPIIIGTIANLYKTKGLEHLVQSAKILKDDKINFEIFIIGEGSERKNLEELISELELQNNVFLVGRKNDASALLKAFDIYACSSVKEGFPYSLIEAIQAELAIVSTNVGGIPEITTDKVEGLLIKPRNERELAEKIKELINNKELLDKIKQKAKEKSVKEFTLESMLKKTKSIY